MLYWHSPSWGICDVSVRAALVSILLCGLDTLLFGSVDVGGLSESDPRRHPLTGYATILYHHYHHFSRDFWFRYGLRIPLQLGRNCCCLLILLVLILDLNHPVLYLENPLIHPQAASAGSGWQTTFKCAASARMSVTTSLSTNIPSRKLLDLSLVL